MEYIQKCMERALNTCIKAAKGQSIEEDEDFMKELKILERQKKQDIAAEASKLHFSKEEVWNILEYVYFPLVEDFEKAIHTANDVFRFSQMQWYNLLSKTKEMRGGLHVNQVMRGTQNSQVLDFVNNAQSMWFGCELMNPMHPTSMRFQIEKRFYITFFEDHYFVDGILNRNFPYGKYPTEEDKQKIVSQFKKDILDELKSKM